MQKYLNNLNQLLNITQKDKYDKTTKIPIAKFNDKEIYITEFLFAKQLGLIKKFQGHHELKEYFILLPYIFANNLFDEIFQNKDNHRYIYSLFYNTEDRIFHIIDEDDFLITCYINTKKNFKKQLNNKFVLKEKIKSEREGGYFSILSPAEPFWHQSDLISKLYHKFYNLSNITITHINFAKGFRGGERQTLLLIQELSQIGYQQKLFTRLNSELANRLKDTPNLEIIKISKPYIFHINKIKNSDIIHAHETKGAQFAYFANLFFNIPYIITRRVDNPIKNNFFNKLIYTKSFYTIALSNAIKQEILKIDKNINIQIIPSAYSKLKVNYENTQKIKQRFKDKFLIANIGELDNTHKGQYYLIEAMKQLQTTYPQIHLILLGRGKDEEKYKLQSQNLSNITFEGFVDNVGDYINALDLFVFPSLHEGLGSILFDIMQSKVPIIATNTGGIPDIIEHNNTGILIPIKDSNAIYQAIIKLYEDKKLAKKLALNAFNNIENFSPKAMMNKYIKIYHE